MSIFTEIYLKYKRNIVDLDDIAAGTPDLTLALLDSSHVPDLATHDFFNDVSGDEIPATGGYAAGGFPLTGLAVTEVTTYVSLTADPFVIPSLTADFGFAVLYLDTGTPSTSPLVALLTYDVERNWPGSDYTLIWPDAAGGGVLSYF